MILCVLAGSDLWKYLESKPPLVERMLDPNLQVGANGIDLSISEIETFSGSGALGFKSSDRKEAPTVRIDNTRSVHLGQGSYKIRYNEIVHIPLDLIAIARPRSSLLRYGATVQTAVWDAGYEGRSESLLIVHNENGLNLIENARVVQLIFLRTTKQLKTGYNGIYKGENIKSVRPVSRS